MLVMTSGEEKRYRIRTVRVLRPEFLCYTRRSSIPSPHGPPHVVEIAQAGLKQRPFHKRGRPVAVVHYQSEQSAREFLQSVMASNRGIGFLFGPDGSGKKTVIRDFVRHLPANHAAAIIDGERLNGAELLAALHSWFGRASAPDSQEASLRALESYLAQQTHYGRVPLIVIDNIGQMFPSALQVLCRIAEFSVGRVFAARMVLVSETPNFNVINAPAMKAIASRMVSAFEMGPMTVFETVDYLHTKLRAAGIANPNHAMPAYICDELYLASHGWPGKLDDIATRALERAGDWPIRYDHIYAPEERVTPAPDLSIVRDQSAPDAQKLYLTLNRKTLQEFDLSDSKTLIGRSDICDVCVNSRFISKHHALLMRKDDALLLIDLNSTNGTFVNSRRIESAVLRNDDVISLGNHGIKLVAPTYKPGPDASIPDLADTTTMRTLEDLRQQESQPQDDLLPVLKDVVT